MAAARIRIALLDCDTPVPLVLAERGMYSDIFRELILDAAAKREKAGETLGNIEWQFKMYHCIKGELPSEKELQIADGVLLTGSASSAYDDEPWIKNLNIWTRNAYINHPHILLFGSCFGHQLICQALFMSLPPQTSVITRSPHGWEVGIQTITLSCAFISHFGPVINNSRPSASPSVVRMQFIRADHLSPLSVPALPPGFVSIGKTEGCEIQGVWQKDRVLTYQGHIEFDGFVNRETIKVFETLGGWEGEKMRAVLESTEGVDDAQWASGVLVRFFEEGVANRRSARVARQGVEVVKKEMEIEVCEVVEVGGRCLSKRAWSLGGNGICP